MPFTLSQLKSQDLRDINQFYFQNNIGKVNNTNAQTFQARCTLPPGNEADSPIHTYSKRRKKNNRHEADLDTDSVDIDRTLILNDANDLHVNNAACSTGVEEDNNIFKASTQLSEYAEFFSGVEEYNDMFRTSTQVSACAAAQNTENYNNELKIKKKHKKNRRQKENEVENLYENFHTKKEKNKTKPITVVDVELQGNNTKGEYVLQDSESSCATECSNKSKRKKKKQQHDNDVQTLESFNVTLINKPKKKKLQSISEDDSEKSNFHLATGADNSSVLMENTEKLDDFVMPKKLKLEEVNTFSTDLDLLDSVVDVKLQDSNTKGEYVLQDFESSWATEYSKKPKRKKKKQQHDNDVQTLESFNVTLINKPKKKKLQSISEDDSVKYHIHLATGADNSAVLMENTEKLDDFVMPKKLKLEEDNTFSTDSNLLDSYLCFSSKYNHSKKKKREKIESFPMPIVIKTENDLDEEEQSLRNAVQNSPIHSDHSIGSTSKKHKKKRKDHSVEQDKNYSHEAKSLNKKHEKKYIQQVLEDMIKNMKDKDSEQIENSNNENSNQTKMQIENVREEEQRLSNIKNSTLIDSVKKKYSSKQLNTDVTSTVQENDESYLTFKNILLDSETPPQICDINDKLINLESDRKSKKHKKKSKDNRKIDKKCSEVLSAENEKSSAEDEQKNEKENVGDKANQLVSKEDITGGCKEEKFKQKHKKKSKVTMEDREMHSDLILEPLININMEESSSSDGPDDRFYIKKRNGRVDLCNIQDEKGIQTHLLNNENITGTCTDRFEIKAVVKRRFDLYELHESNDVRNGSLNRKACDDVVNAFKEKLSIILNQCSKQICSESFEIDNHRKNKTLLGLQVNLMFTEARNDTEGKVDYHKNEKMPECAESEVASLANIKTHDNKVQDCTKLNSNKSRKEKQIISLNTIKTQNDVQEGTKVNYRKSKKVHKYKNSKVTLLTNRTQFDFNTINDCINNSAEIAVDCKVTSEMCTSSKISQKLTEDLTVCEDINFNSSSMQQSIPFNENLKIIQNVRLTESQKLTHSCPNHNAETIISKVKNSPRPSEIESQLESITEEDITLIAEELNCISASIHIQTDKNSNDETKNEILNNLEIQTANSEHRSDVSSVSLNRGITKLTIFDEDTVVLTPNKNKLPVCRNNEETDGTFIETSKENNNHKLECVPTIIKKVEECNFESFFNNNCAETNTEKECNKETKCQKQLIFNKKPEHLNNQDITGNSSAVNKTSESSNKSSHNESRELQDDLSLTKSLQISFEDLDSSFFLSDSDCEPTQKKRVGKSSSKHISPNLTDLCNQLMCDTSLDDGDETTSVDDIINEVLDNAAETSIHLVEEHQFLKDLVVHIPWEIPLAHTIETRMSSQPSAAQKEKFKEMNIPLKLGPYSKEEDKKILNNFEEFCKVHDIPHDSKPFLNFKHGRKMTLLNVKQRINFVQYLGKNLECRMLHSIYRRFVCLCTEKKKGRFTEEEDTIIQKYITNPQNKYDNKKFSTLAIILNRHRLAIEKRYKYLLSKEKLRKDNYKIRDHIPEYLKYLMEILKVNEVSQLKNMKITRDVWLKLADKIGQDQVKVKRIWETIIYPRLFAKNPIDRDQLMKQLILKLIKLKKTDYRDVNWCEMASEFENVTPAYLYQVFRILVANNVPERKRHDLSSTLKHLARAYRECDCIMKTQSKIEFENGQVSFIADP